MRYRNEVHILSYMCVLFHFDTLSGSTDRNVEALFSEHPSYVHHSGMFLPNTMQFGIHYPFSFWPVSFSGGSLGQVTHATIAITDWQAKQHEYPTLDSSCVVGLSTFYSRFVSGQKFRNYLDLCTIF